MRGEERRGGPPTALRQANACPIHCGSRLVVAVLVCRKRFCRSAKCRKDIEQGVGRSRRPFDEKEEAPWGERGFSKFPCMVLAARGGLPIARNLRRSPGI